MVCNRKDDDSLAFRSVNERERGILDEDSAGIGTMRRTREGKGKRSGGGLFHRGGEAHAQPGLSFTVIDDLGWEFEAWR